jgi:hypothetical protein
MPICAAFQLIDTPMILTALPEMPRRHKPLKELELNVFFKLRPAFPNFRFASAKTKFLF